MGEPKNLLNRGLRRRLGQAALVCLVGLALAGPARAATYSQSDDFYWPLPSTFAYGEPSGIAVSPDGNLVYVADGPADVVATYSSDGQLVRLWPKSGVLGRPSSITTDGTGAVYVLYPEPEEIVRYAAGGTKVLARWNVPFARAIAASGAGRLYVLTNFLNAVGVFNSKGESIGGFVANLPGQFFPKTGFAPNPGITPETGYDPPYKTVATEIAVDASGNPTVVGESRQARNNDEPDCSYVIHEGIDNRPYPDPLVSGEAARFTPTGAHIGYGWLTKSQWFCGGFGWHSDATDPTGAAVDPNSGDVFATSYSDLGVIHLRSDLVDHGDPNVNAYAPPCYTYTCSGSVSDWELIADNEPDGVAIDCHSNLYMLSAGLGGSAGFVTKFLNTDHPLPSSCPSRFGLEPPKVQVFKVGVGKLGPMKVLAGCSGRLCAGNLAVRSSSSLCPNCTLSAPRHFRIAAGLRRTLSLKLNGTGRRLLRTHPGLPIKIFGRLKGGPRFSQNEALRPPAVLGAKCSFAGTFGGPATVSGSLSPSHAGQKIGIEYLPHQPGRALLPAVQHTVLTNRSGHFSDRLDLGSAGKWLVVASWAGDRAHEPATAPPCAGTVAQIPTHVSLTCPTGSSAGSPAQFSGTLSQADATLGVVYNAPSGATIGHVVSSGKTGNFTDTFSPSEPGAWQASAHYKGDANHAGAEATCRFDVAPDDFSISVTPSSGSAAQGGSVNATLNTAVTSGAAQAMSLSSSGAPGTVTFSPTTITAGGSSNVTISVPASTAPGTYGITLTGAGAWATHSTAYTLTVRRPTSLTLQCTPDPSRRFISCTGQLTSGGSGIGGAQVTITYQPPGSASPTTDTATTAPGGTYTDQLNAPAGALLASGDWQVQASFAGDATDAPASRTQTVTVP